MVEKEAYVNSIYGEIELLIPQRAGSQGQQDKPGHQRLRQSSVPIGYL